MTGDGVHKKLNFKSEPLALVTGVPCLTLKIQRALWVRYEALHNSRVWGQGWFACELPIYRAAFVCLVGCMHTHTHTRTHTLVAVTAIKSMWSWTIFTYSHTKLATHTRARASNRNAAQFQIRQWRGRTQSVLTNQTSHVLYNRLVESSKKFMAGCMRQGHH